VYGIRESDRNSPIVTSRRD